MRRTQSTLQCVASTDCHGGNMTRMSRALRMAQVGLATTALMVFPAVAQAGTLTLGDDAGLAVLTYTAAPGETNLLRLTETTDTGTQYLEITDSDGVAVTVDDSAALFCDSAEP